MPTRGFSGPLLAALALAALWAAPGRAEPPSAAWRTLDLPHFRVHYPASSEVWARRVAGRLEAIRARLAREVGYEPPQVVDVVVANPAARPNGSAWPFLGRPLMVLWTSPPEPASILGVYRDWGELVSVHEEAHLVHLLRPSRNPFERLAERLLPGFGLGPVTRRAPRWAIEGYATLLEGRLTGSGRPNSDLRAAVLRERARAGLLPSYGALSAGDRSWLGPSMAYLAGSAFLEWLEERAGPASLPHLWARLTARRNRSFEEAFAGVFGDSPQVLWGRFSAELTWRAVEAEHHLGGPPEEAAGQSGELWQDLSRQVGAPAVSPDGSRLAVVLRPRDEPPRLVVYATGPNEEAEARHRKEQAEILARDRQDVAAVRSGPLPRTPVAVLPTIDGRAPLAPRWTADGRRLVFVAFGPDPDGDLHPDLYRWGPEDGRLERLTRLADLRSPDPAPGAPSDPGLDGGWAVAVRDRDGLSQLVAVDLSDGRVAPLTPAAADTVWASPRIAPGGRRLAALRHREGRWRLVVGELTTSGTPDPGAGGLDAIRLAGLRQVDVGPATTLADPAWAPDGRSIYLARGSGGFVDLWAVDAGPAAGAGAAGAGQRRLTRALGAALAPAPAPDGSAVYFLSLEDDGFDLRRLDLAAAPASGPGVARELPPEPAPAPRPGGARSAPEAAAFPAAELPPSRPYGLGPQSIEPLVGLVAAPSGRALELGVRGGDPVGRLDGFLLGSLAGAGAARGGTLAATWRGLPAALSAQAFAVSETPSDQADAPPALRPGGPLAALDRERRGLALGTRWDRRSATGGLAVALGLLGERVEPASGAGGGALERRLASLGAAFARAPSRGRWSLPLHLSGHLERGATGGRGWSRWEASLGLGVERGDDGLHLTWGRGGSRDLAAAFDRFRVGGVPRSLVPAEADGGVVPVPALPAAYLVGDDHESWRAELDLPSLGFLPAPLLFERHRVWDEGHERGGWLDLAGLELRRDLPPLPIVGIPALHATAGAAYVLDDPAGDLAGEVRLWLAVAWRP